MHEGRPTRLKHSSSLVQHSYVIVKAVVAKSIAVKIVSCSWPCHGQSTAVCDICWKKVNHACLFRFLSHLKAGICNGFCSFGCSSQRLIECVWLLAVIIGRIVAPRTAPLYLRISDSIDYFTVSTLYSPSESLIYIMCQWHLWLVDLASGLCGCCFREVRGIFATSLSFNAVYRT